MGGTIKVGTDYQEFVKNNLAENYQEPTKRRDILAAGFIGIRFADSFFALFSVISPFWNCVVE